jgi:hypothetical protein
MPKTDTRAPLALVLLASVFPIDVSVWHLKNRFHCRNLVADMTLRNVNEHGT